MMFMGISHDVRYPRQGGNFLRSSLRVTACDDDSAASIRAPNAANCRPRFLFGGGGHGAGIHYHPVGLAGFSSTIEPSLPELLLHGSPVRLRGAAPEIFYVKPGHRTILAYIHLRMGNCRIPLYV